MNILALSSVTATVREKTPLDNYITIGLVALLALLVIAIVIRKAVLNRKAKAQSFAIDEAPSSEAPVAAGSDALAKGSAGKIKLHDVEPKTAAMLMAIVADKTGKPLNELRFISIKEVK